MADLSISRNSTINIIRTGPRGGIPVVLVHAVGLDLTLWGQQIEALQKEHDVVAFDLPGHGLSDKVDEPSFTKFSSAVAQVIMDLAAGPVHLVGLSFGGMVIQTVALEHPDLVYSLSLIGTACTFQETGRVALRERAQFVRNNGMRGVAPLSLARWFTPGFSARRPDVIDRIAKILYQQDSLFHAAMWDMISTLNTEAALLKQVSVPAQVIVGAEDTSTPIAAAHILAKALNTVNIHVVPDASHLTNLEAPEIINNLLINFFKSFK